TSFFNGNTHGIGIDGTAGNLTRNVNSTGGTGTFAITHADGSTHTATVSRLSGNASLISFSSGVLVTIGGTGTGASGIDFGSGLSTILGTLRINVKGFVSTNAPTYGASSLLQYNTGNTFGRGTEWSATSNPGYPGQVEISGNTTLDLGNGGS